MTEEAKNKAILAEAYSKWHETKGGSTAHWISICDDSIDFRSLADGRPNVAFTARRNGCAEVGCYLNDLVADWEMIHYTVGNLIAEGDRVVMLGSCAWRSRKTGKTVETPKADFWRFKNGKAIEYFEFYDTASLYAAASG